MILLVGGTGTLGRELQRTLGARGEEFRILTRTPAAANASGAAVRGDVRDAGSLAKALVGVDTVVSAVTGFGLGGAGPMTVDLAGNRTLVEAAGAARVRRFIHISVFGARADHPLELYRAKHSAEDIVRSSGLEWTIVRPTPFLETWASILGSSVRTSGRAVVFGSGRNPINFVSVRDVAFIVERAVAGPELWQHAVDVGGPENVTMNDLVDAIGASAGRSVAARHIPRAVLRIGAALTRVAKPDVARLLAAAIQMDTTDMTYDDSALRRLQPDVPRTRVSDVVREMMAA